MSVNSLTEGPETLRLLQEAAQWRLLGLLFERPGKDWHSEVAALAAEVQDETLRQAAAAAQQEAGEGLYDTIFGPGGPASPREVSYRKTELSGQFLAELQAFYDAFAYQPSIDEPPDHVAVEAGFVAYLRLKEVYGQFDGRADVAAQAAAAFVEYHVAVLADGLSRRLADSGFRYLLLASEALKERAGPARETQSAGLEILNDEDSYDCTDEGTC